MEYIPILRIEEGEYDSNGRYHSSGKVITFHLPDLPPQDLSLQDEVELLKDIHDVARDLLETINCMWHYTWPRTYEEVMDRFEPLGAALQRYAESVNSAE